MNITKLGNKIRDFINIARRQNDLLKDSAAWNKLCSSLDLIEDTQLAIESYPQFFSVKDEGASYLIVYGILQTLLLQQNAATDIGDVLDIKIKRPKELDKIRIIRNSAVGHPGQQKENGILKSSFIARMSISPGGFKMMTVYSEEKEGEFITISIPDLIKTQEIYLTKMLFKVVSELERQELEHRKMHRDKKLVDIFPHTLRYHFGKLLETSSRVDKFPLALMDLEVVSECLENLRGELLKRDEWGVYDSINNHYELIEYPLVRLRAYFEGTDDMNEKDAYIFTTFIYEQMKKLKEIAIELDEKYENGL